MIGKKDAIVLGVVGLIALPIIVAGNSGAAREQIRPTKEEALVTACNYHAESNMKHFDLLLRTLHPGSPVTAADMQKTVVKLCTQGADEHDAYKTVANLLGANVR